MNQDSEKIALVELHDARVSRLCLEVGGHGGISFSHVAVYRRVGEEELHIWSYEAEITLSGISGLVTRGVMEADDYLVDDEIVASDGETLPCELLLGGAGIARLALRFSSGATVVVTAERACLELRKEIRFLEKWIGPL